MPWLSPKDLTGYRYRYISRGERNITKEGQLSCSTKLLPTGTILFSSRAPIGYVAIAQNPLCTNQGFKSIVPNEKTDSLFLYYLLKCNAARIDGLGSGTTFKEVSGKVIGNYEVLVPENIWTQRRVANVLGTIDNKIELNQKINDYLAELAQTLFIGWFELHAGERDIASLTGDDEYCTLDKLCSRITDGAHKSPKADPDGAYPMLSVKDMRQYGFSYSSCKRISKADYDDMLANDCIPKVDDILVAKDGSYLKEIFITNKQREEAILSSIAIFRPDTRRIAPEVLLQYLKHPRVLKLVSDNFVSGSALPRIVLKDFKKLMLLVPERSIQEEILPALRSDPWSNSHQRRRVGKTALIARFASTEAHVE